MEDWMAMRQQQALKWLNNAMPPFKRRCIWLTSFLLMTGITTSSLCLAAGQEAQDFNFAEIKTPHAASPAVSQKARPENNKSAGIKPVKAKPVKARPAGSKPAEVKPVEAKAAGSKSAEVMPVEIKPAENTAIENIKTEKPVIASHPADQKKPDTAVLNFVDANLMDIVRVVGEITGENFIVGPGISARITIQTAKPVPKKDVFGIFESILDVQGLSAVKTGDYYKIVQAATAKQRSVDVRSDRDIDAVPPGDRVITQIVPIEFISVGELIPVLQPLVSPAGSVQNYAKANTLVVTDIASGIKKILDIIKVLDTDAFKRMNISIEPVNVDVKTLHKELTEILSALGIGKEPGQLAIIPIERLNSLVMFATNEALLNQVKEWIKKLDLTTTSGMSSRIYYVKNDKASTLKAILDQIYGGKTASAAGEPVKQPSSEAGGSRQASSGAQGQSQAAKQDAVGGNVRIFLYEPSNALIIQASQADYQNVLNTLKDLDHPSKQVLIDALIAEVKLDETTKFGIQWSLLSGNTNIQQNTGIAAAALKDPAGSISPTPPIGTASPAGLTVFATDASRFFGIIQAMASTGKLNVLSNPHIVVKNYEKASINIGSDEPIATQSTQTPVTGTAGLVQNIEYRKTGVLLTVTPNITEDGVVAMSVRQEVSDKSTDRTVGSSLYPSFTKREAETSVVAKDGETLVIGGLIQEKKDDSSSGIPFLSDIPFLGYLFKYTTHTIGKTELVILITPKIIGTSAQALSVTEEMKNKLKGLKELLRATSDEN
ncbi:MAG: type II secretion system secretin GspD [Deltaproteobacteria bacterium]|nr:type II secretion system secretin GspD [Deltaproteobacteria bacterium]